MNLIDFIKKDIELNGDHKIIGREGRTDAELREHRKAVISGQVSATTVREFYQPIVDILGGSK